MDIFKFLKKKGINTINGSFYSQIKLWESWYIGDVRSFHRYRIYNGKRKVQCRRLSLGMAKKLSEDIADLLLNERVKITISDEVTETFVNDVLSKNKFLVRGNQYQEHKAATGTVAYVLNLINAEADGNGYIRGGDISIRYVKAHNIYPISWNNGTITECAFVFYKTIDRKKYAIIQFHQKEGGKYVITNDVIDCTNGSGNEIKPEQWRGIAGFEGLQSRINTDLDEPLFVIDTLNIVNNADDDDTNPMGAAIFANAIDTLTKIDLEYDSYANEFEMGRKRIFVAPELLNLDGEPSFDPNDTTFYQLPEDTLKDTPIIDINMDIRAEQHSKAINDDLNLLSVKTGFGTGHYKFDRGTLTTATQVISENSDMYRSLKKHELILEDVIKDLIMAIVRLGKQIGVSGLADSFDITVDFDDSIIEDKGAERERDRQDVAMGVMSHAEYRAKWYGETLEEAAKNLPEQIEEVIDTVRYNL